MDIKYIQDSSNNQFYPVVHEKGVIDDNGVTLETKLANLPSGDSSISSLDDVPDGTTRKLSDYLKTTDISSWAKASTKPSYTASEVGALPTSTVIPTALEDLTDDSTHRLVTDTEKATWNANTSNIGTVTGVIVESGTTISPNSNGVVDMSSLYTALVNRIAALEAKVLDYTYDSSTSTLTFTEPST